MANTTAPTNTPQDAAKDNQRFANQKDERLNPDQSYGAGTKDKTNPAPSTMPSSPQTNVAKPIESGNLRPEVND